MKHLTLGPLPVDKFQWLYSSRLVCSHLAVTSCMDVSRCDKLNSGEPTYVDSSNLKCPSLVQHFPGNVRDNS
jgi:hypothetical protein